MSAAPNVLDGAIEVLRTSSALNEHAIRVLRIVYRVQTREIVEEWRRFDADLKEMSAALEALTEHRALEAICGYAEPLARLGSRLESLAERIGMDLGPVAV